MTASYIKLLQKQRSMNSLTASEEGSSRTDKIPGAGVAFQGTTKYNKKEALGPQASKPLVTPRSVAKKNDEDDILTMAYNNVLQENNFIKTKLKKSLSEEDDLGNTKTPEYGKRLLQDIEETLGLKPHQAAALVGNFDHETGGFKFMKEINPVVKGSAGGQGIAMWTGSRRNSFLNWSKENNLNPNSYEANFGYFIHEVQNTSEGKFLENLENTDTVEQAATVVSKKYLRPGKPMLNKRIALSKSYLEN